MKRSFAVLFLLILGASLSVQAASLQPVSALDARAGSYGGLGQKCRGKHRPACDTGLFCDSASQRCIALAATGRPNKAPCAAGTTADASCTSGYCANDGLCHTPRKNGKGCNRNAQCGSGLCSTKGKCIKSTQAHPAPTSTASQASAALASATPVSNSAQYNNAKLLPGDGEVRTTGSVSIVTTQSGGQAVEVFADAQHPAVLQKVLATKLARRQTSTANDKIFSFNYNVASFTTSNTATGQCSIVPSIDGNQLSPATVVKTGTTSGTVVYRYTGSVSSYAVSLVCDAISTAKVQYDTITVTPASGTTTTSATTTIATATKPPPTTTTTTSAVATFTPAASACSGLDNCGFENRDSDNFVVLMSTDSVCMLTKKQAYVHSGAYAEQCQITGAEYGHFLITGGDKRTYVDNSDYTWQFWVKLDKGADATALQCQITQTESSDVPIYQGKCPFTTAATQNGFYQVSIPFTAQSTSITFQVEAEHVPGTYLFDDFSILDGKQSVNYATSTPTPVSVAPPAPTVTQTCNGFENCGFETGDTTGYATVQDGHTICDITTGAANAHAGTNAFLCTIDDNSKQTTDGGLIAYLAEGKVVSGNKYQFSFWSKTNSADGGIYCDVSQNGETYRSWYYDPPMPAVQAASSSSNGYARYAIDFTSTTMGEIRFDCRARTKTTPATYYFDDFSLTRV